MRVTNGMIRNNTLNNLYKNIAAVNESYAQMSTGKKIQTVSDDPIIAGRAIKLKVNVLETQQYQKNAKEARSWMEVTETSIDNISKILESIRTKCVQASTGTLEENDKAVIKTDIMQLWEQLQDEANVSYGGRYIYSGYKTDESLMLNKDFTAEKELKVEKEYHITAGTTLAEGTVLNAGSKLSKKDRETLGITDEMLDEEDKLKEAFTVPTGSITLNDGAALSEGSSIAEQSVLITGNLNPQVYGKITGQEMKYEIGVGSTISVNTSGMDETFNQLLGMMQEIVTTVNQSLEEGENAQKEDLHDLFNDAIGEIDKALDNISTKSADLGSRLARLDFIEERLTDNSTSYKELLSNTEDIDVEEVYVEFNSRYAAYTAALQATSKVIMNTLADYL